MEASARQHRLISPQCDCDGVVANIDHQGWRSATVEAYPVAEHERRSLLFSKLFYRQDSVYLVPTECMSGKGGLYMTWKVGDTVQLNSGGPIMTVTAVGNSMGDATVWCVWFVGTKKESGTFPPAALKAA